jgi:hypothetical protein
VTLPDALSGDVRPIPAADEGSIERKDAGNLTEESDGTTGISLGSI